MNPQLFTQPLSDYNLDSLANKDGVIEVIPAFRLDDVDDKFIIKSLGDAINKSMDYYDDANQYNLKNKRLKNAQMLEGKHLQEHKLYRHQTPYIDNEIFVGIDAILSYVTARAPQAEVYPAKDTDEAKVAAKDLESYLFQHSKRFELNRKMESTVLNTLSKYVGFLKLRWDPLYGNNGEIIPEVVDPNHIIVDKNAKMGENPRFICHVLKDTIEGLIAKFPDKEKEILRSFAIERKGPKNTTAEIVYREVWFTYYDKDHKPQEAVAWYTNDLVLAKYKNPNWLYENQGENFLDNPMKPFIPFNFMNDGSNWLDKTSALEQAVSQQDVLNKIGRQNVDNIATANGFKVIDAHAMRSEDVQNFTGDPNQLLLVKTKQGQSVRDVVAQLPPQIVSQQAIAMVADNRQTIHNILGTPSQFRGDDEDMARTATQAMMIKNQASGRQDKLVRAIESSMERYYRFLTQMMCVWYDEKHYATVNGGDGNFDYIEMHRDKIHKGTTVNVAEGTTLPFDKQRQEAVAQNAAQLGLISPYDYYKLMHMEKPQKLYDNFMKFKKDPEALAMDVADNTASREAIVDFTELMADKKPKFRNNPTPQYIEQMRKLMISDDFFKAKKKIQDNVIEFIKAERDSLAVRTALENVSMVEQGQEEPLPQQVQDTMIPYQQNPNPAPAIMPMGQPPMGNPAMPPQQGMPQAPVAPPALGGVAAQIPQGSPIQSILQNAAPQAPAPNLNPAGPPQPQPNIGQIRPF